MLRFLVLLFIGVGLLAFTTGCGDDEVTTVPREDRPTELKQPVEGTPPKTSEGEELPEGLEKVD